MHLYLQPDLRAQMAELVDALDSKSGYRKVVQVRFLFWAQYPLSKGFFHSAKCKTCKPFMLFPSFHFLLFDVILSFFVTPLLPG